MSAAQAHSSPQSPAADRNVHAQGGGIPRAERHAALRTSGATLWFTGLSGSGKSTITAALERELIRRGRFCYRLDGDNIRLGLNKDLGFSPEDRHENIRRIGEVAHLFADAGVIALVGFISPYRADRDVCRRAHEQSAFGSGGPLPFIEVFVDTPLDVCERRDPKGLYKKARAGNLPHFTGIDDPYEAPLKPELVLRTATMGVEECVKACMTLLRDRGIVLQ